MNNPVRRATRADDFLNGLDVKSLAAKMAFYATLRIQGGVGNRWSRNQSSANDSTEAQNQKY
jgi:hypothetical protein